MSASKWAYTDDCDGKPCCGECDLCSYAEERISDDSRSEDNAE